MTRLYRQLHFHSFLNRLQALKNELENEQNIIYKAAIISVEFSMNQINVTFSWWLYLSGNKLKGFLIKSKTNSKTKIERTFPHMES